MAKKAIGGNSESALDMELAYQAMIECLSFSMEDGKEGMRAFLGRMKPRFSCR